jgi:hypothetical protein
MGYARVSTTKQAAQGDSLELQDELIGSDIRDQGWVIVPDGRVLQEPFTGTTQDRRVYREALRFIKAHRGKVKYFVIRSIDRFTREGSRTYQQMKEELAALGVELRDIGKVIQPTVDTLEHTGFSYKWSRRSPSAISEVVLAEVGSAEISTMLTRMIGSEINLVGKGYHIGPANDGYVSRRISVDGKKRVALFPDPERASFYRRIFEMRAEGTFSDQQIVEELNRLGFRTRSYNHWNDRRTRVLGTRAGKPLCVKQLQLIIRRPVYCGIVCKKWTHGKPVVAAGGEPIVSIELWNRANRGKRLIEWSHDGTLRMLHDHQEQPIRIKRHRFRTVFPYKNVVACPICHKPLIASFSRGRRGIYYGAYHCARQHSRWAVPKKDLEEMVKAFLEELRPAPGTWKRIDRILRVTYAEATKDSADVAKQLEDRLAELAERKDQLTEAFTVATSAIMRSDIEKKAETLEREMEVARANRQTIDVSPADFERFIAYAKDLVEHPAEILANIENLDEQRALYSLFFDGLPTYPEIVNRTAPLTFVFNGFGEGQAPESSSVRHRSIGWNHSWRALTPIIQQWVQAAPVIETVLERMLDRRKKVE